MKRRKETEKEVNREKIVAEYLHTDKSFAELGAAYGLPWRTIQSWVRAYRKAGGEAAPPAQSAREKALETELEELRLKNALLEETLRLSEELTGVKLRKKSGARP